MQLLKSLERIGENRKRHAGERNIGEQPETLAITGFGQLPFNYTDPGIQLFGLGLMRGGKNREPAGASGTEEEKKKVNILQKCF